MRPHDQGILVPVVVLSHTHRSHTELPVELLGAPVGSPYLEGQVLGASRQPDMHQRQHETGSHGRHRRRAPHGQRVYVGVPFHQHETAVTDRAVLMIRHEVRTARSDQLRLEHLAGPRHPEGRDLELQDLIQVPGEQVPDAKPTVQDHRPASRRWTEPSVTSGSRI